MEEKECFPFWLNCPNRIGETICTKIRFCSEERKCFNEWIKRGGVKATKEMIEKWRKNLKKI